MDDPIVDEAYEPPSISAAPSRRKLLVLFIWLCCTVFFIVDVITPIYFNDFVMAMLFLGVVTAQLTVICVWGTLVRGTFIVRLPWTILLLVISWSGFSLGVGIKRGTYDADAMLGIAFMWAIGFITSLVPLKIAAMGFGWQIVQASSSDHVRTKNARYTISDIMLGTLLIAISLAIIRAMVRIEDIGFSESLRTRFLGDAKGWVLIAFYGVISLLVKLPCIWISLAQKNGKILSWIFLWVIYCLLLATTEIVVFTVAFGAPPSDSKKEYAAIIIGHQIMGAVILTVCLALRGLGYRLERSLRRPSKVQHAEEAAKAEDESIVESQDWAASLTSEELP